MRERIDWSLTSDKKSRQHNLGRASRDQASYWDRDFFFLLSLSLFRHSGRNDRSAAGGLTAATSTSVDRDVSYISRISGFPSHLDISFAFPLLPFSPFPSWVSGWWSAPHQTQWSTSDSITGQQDAERTPSLSLSALQLVHRRSIFWYSLKIGLCHPSQLIKK